MNPLDSLTLGSMSLKDIGPYLERFGRYFLDTGLSTLQIFGIVLIPLVLWCLILGILAWWQSKRLMETFGWHGLLVTGWLGTPVHELSHAFAAVLLGHQVTSLKLFKPDASSGQLGCVEHTYNRKNPYAAVLGNTLIPMAPFAGGVAVMILLTMLLMPELVPWKGKLRNGLPMTADILLNPANYGNILSEAKAYFVSLWGILRDGHFWTRWQFYVYIYVMLCVGMHLAPSRQDFKNFWLPFVVFLLLLFAVNLAVRSFYDTTGPVSGFLRTQLAALNGLMAFVLVVSFCGAVLVTILTFIMNWMKK